jgi:hypothetical protein
MQCRQCGIEIADKALICYRCGTATTEAKYQPAPLPRKGASSSRTLIVIVLVIAVLVLLALYLWSAVLTAERASFDTVRMTVTVRLPAHRSAARDDWGGGGKAEALIVAVRPEPHTTYDSRFLS